MSDPKYPGGMHVEESGTPSSPAIVFIHGAGQSGRVWRQHMASLSDYHCLAPDLPGFGRSNHLAWAPKERVADLLAELIETRVPAKRASLVGVSAGGLHIHALLDRHPDRVERAVLDGAPPYDATRAVRAFMRLVSVSIAAFATTRPVTGYFHRTHDPEDLRAASRLAMVREFAQCFGTFATFDAPCPTLLVAGEQEKFVRPTNAAMAELMPHGEARFVLGLEHVWQRAEPELHIRMVEAWVSGDQLPSELRRESDPSSVKVERLRRTGPNYWYVRHKRRIMLMERFFFRHYRKVLSKSYGESSADVIAGDALQRLEALLPDLPYIGGRENDNTPSLYMAAASLGLYRALKARGATVDEAARVLYLGAESLFLSFPIRWLMRWQGRSLFGPKSLKQLRGAAALSQHRRYPYDWVFEVVAGDGQDFDLGIDYHECGIVKLFQREGAPELAPYGCWLDYPMFAALALRLERTETLAQGGQRCDFRVSRGEPVQVEPEFLHV